MIENKLLGTNWNLIRNNHAHKSLKAFAIKSQLPATSRHRFYELFNLTEAPTQIDMNFISDSHFGWKVNERKLSSVASIQSPLIERWIAPKFNKLKRSFQM